VTRPSKRELETAVDELADPDVDPVRAWFEERLADGWAFIDTEPADSDLVTVVETQAGAWRVPRESLPEFVDAADLPIDRRAST
jgi:phytoene/squalene synthetase